VNTAMKHMPHRAAQDLDWWDWADLGGGMVTNPYWQGV
jgi:hypothetical protein